LDGIFESLQRASHSGHKTILGVLTFRLTFGKLKNVVTPQTQFNSEMKNQYK